MFFPDFPIQEKPLMCTLMLFLYYLLSTEPYKYNTFRQRHQIVFLSDKIHVPVKLHFPFGLISFS